MKYLIGVLLCMLSYQNIQACDACGCASAGSMLGLVPNYMGHFVSLRGRYASFAANDGSGSNEIYQGVLQLGYRPRFAPRWSVLGILPYQQMTHTDYGESSSRMGLGDASAILSYRLLERSDTLKSVVNQQLQVGMGLKMPTGDYETQSDQALTPGNFQLGTGSWDTWLQLRYQLQVRALTVLAEANYRYNFENTDDYRFGDQLSLTASVAYNYATPRINFVPYGGLSYEYLALDVFERYRQPRTGGNGLYAVTGMEAFVKRFSVGLSAQIPLASDYAQGELSANARLMGSITLFL
ncbi:MAG: transporter [Bacteroidota bacterium]